MEKFLAYMKNELRDLESISLEGINANKENTVIVFVDMIKGFYNIGPLSNQKVSEIIKPIVDLNNKTIDYKKIFFVDNHNEDSIEFNSYPKHCIEGTDESELIDELLNSEAIKNKNTFIIKKNSINGFHSDELREIVQDKSIKNFIVTGVCTDICVKNFVISLLTYFNEKNIERKIIVPQNMVETFDADFHNREFWNLTSLFEMKSNGVQIVKEVK